MKVEIGHLTATLARAKDGDTLSLQDGKLSAKSKPGFFSGLMFWKRGDDVKAQMDVRASVKMCLLETYGLSMDYKTFNEAMDDISWNADHPLSARVVTQLVDKLNERRAGEFTDDRLQQPTTVLGSGNVNTVYLGNWGAPKEPPEKRVFKEDHQTGRDELQVAAQAIGVKDSDAHMSARNVATYRLNEALGLSLIPRTDFAAHKGKTGSVMALAPGVSVQGSSSIKVSTPLNAALSEESKGRIENWLNQRELKLLDFDEQSGVLTVVRNVPKKDLAHKAALLDLLTEEREIMSESEIYACYGEEEGESKSMIWRHITGLTEAIIPALNFGDEELRSGLNQLQWLDSFCGQTDRHPGNIFVERAPNGSVIGVQGIDNDASFGVNTTASRAASQGGHEKVEQFYLGMPTVIDEQLKSQLLALAALPKTDSGSVESLLEGTVSQKEIEQTRSRLDEIALKLREVDVSGAPVVKVVQQKSDWSSADVSDRLGCGSNSSRVESYLKNCEDNLRMFEVLVPQSDGETDQDQPPVHDTFRPRIVDVESLAADFAAEFGDGANERARSVETVSSKVVF